MTAEAIAKALGRAERRTPGQCERAAEVTHRDALVICRACGKRVPRKGRFQVYCSRRCRQRTYWDRKAIAEISAIVTHYTRHSTTPHKSPNKINALGGLKWRPTDFGKAPLNLLGGGLWRWSETPPLDPLIRTKIIAAEIGESEVKGAPRSKLMSSKGFSTRAARDLIDKLVEHDEPITVFCVHDADASGTMIYQTLQEETRARGARKVTIINLGLEPEEAGEMGLEVEDVEEADRRRPVAAYANEWADWLQEHRVELNAMTTPQFIEWLDGKLADYDKLIPPVPVLEKELADEIKRRVRAEVTERVLREAGVDAQVAAAVEATTKPSGEELAKGVQEMLEQEPERSWRDHIRVVAGGE